MKERVRDHCTNSVSVVANKSLVFVQSFTPEAESTVNNQLASIRSLSGKGVTSIDLLSAAHSRPAGCVVFSISSSAAVFLHVKGRVDIEAEISKASKKLDKTKHSIERQKKILNDDDYRQKVDEKLQEVEERKLKDLETEGKAFEETIKQFETLKLE